MNAEVAAEMVAARGVLLDAVDALRPHHNQLTLIGAQAVYLRTGDAGLTTAAYTTDADVAVDPVELAVGPGIDGLLSNAGFARRLNGAVRSRRGNGSDRSRSTADRSPRRWTSWSRTAPHPAPGSGTPGYRTTARTPCGTRQASRHASWIGRSSETNPGRLIDKDASDVLRLLRTADGATSATLARLARHEICGPLTRQALATVTADFGHRGARGVAMAVRALPTETPDLIETQIVGLAVTLAVDVDGGSS